MHWYSIHRVYSKGATPSHPSISLFVLSCYSVYNHHITFNLYLTVCLLLIFPLAYTHPHGTSIQQWSIEDVGDFLSYLGYEAYIDKFTEHEIDGRALSLVRDHHLLMTLKLRLGPALKIIEHVSVIKCIEDIDD